MKVKKDVLIQIIQEEALKLFKENQEQKVNRDTASQELVEKQPYEKNVYEEYGSELTEVVGHMREVVTLLDDMKLKQEAHGKIIPEVEQRQGSYKKALDVLEKASSAADGFAKKLNKLAIVMLKDLE